MFVYPPCHQKAIGKILLYLPNHNIVHELLHWGLLYVDGNYHHIDQTQIGNVLILHIARFFDNVVMVQCMHSNREVYYYD